MKLHTILLLFFIPVIVHASETAIQKNSNQKHVIGVHGRAGFFSAFLCVLNHLSWCEKHHKTPVVYWKNRSLYYMSGGFNGSENVWEYYFEPVSSLKYVNGDAVHNKYAMDWGDFIYWKFDASRRQLAHRLIEKYVKIKANIQEKIDAFYNEHMAGKKTIGIHLRGTDKKREERLVSPEKIVQKALGYAQPDTQFFIASDDARKFNKMKDLLSGYKVIYYDVYRSDSEKPLHKKPSKAQLGEDVLIEVSLLARCDLLVHTLSNVSTGALFFNQAMANVSVS